MAPFLLIPIYAFVFWLEGAKNGAGGLKGWLLAALVAVALVLILGPGRALFPDELEPWPYYLAPIALAMLIHAFNDVPPNTFGAAIDPGKDRLPETFARQFLLIPALLVLVLGYSRGPVEVILGGIAFAVASTALAAANRPLVAAAKRRKNDPDNFVRAGRGAALGLYLATLFV